MSKAPSRTRAWSSRRAGGSFRSRTRWSAASHPERVPSRVELPPGEPLPDRGGQVVVVVVPALAAGEQRDEERVAAGVGGRVPPPAHQVGQRVDDEGPVPEQDGREAETDEEPAPPADEEAGNPERPRRRPRVTVEETQLRVGGEVVDGRRGRSPCSEWRGSSPHGSTRSRRRGEWTSSSWSL